MSKISSQAFVAFAGFLGGYTSGYFFAPKILQKLEEIKDTRKICLIPEPSPLHELNPTIILGASAILSVISIGAIASSCLARTLFK